MRKPRIPWHEEDDDDVVDFLLPTLLYLICLMVSRNEEEPLNLLPNSKAKWFMNLKEEEEEVFQEGRAS